MNNTNGFSFVTDQGNEYYYNDIDGSVLPTALAQKTQSDADDPNFQIRAINKHDDMQDILVNMLKTDGFKQLELIVTHQCNLRCKYCVYSGIYENFRTHNNLFMDISTAKMAIDYFYKGYREAKDIRPNLIPAISFYGGEPLLNFGVIQFAVKYAWDLFRGNVIFNMTTNGTLLNPDIIKFLREYNFDLMFSLNGGKEEHDRLRIFPDGSGSFFSVMTKLEMIRQMDETYMYEKCSLSVVVDDGTDLLELYDFFCRSSAILPTKHVQISRVTESFTDWYSRYTESDRIKYVESLKQLYIVFNQKLKAGDEIPMVLWQLCGSEIRFLLNRAQNSTQLQPLVPYTSTCIPGSKIAIDPNGIFHCCEKINENFPIGDVKKGLDYHHITDLIIKYNDQIISHCSPCVIKRLCPVCYATVASSNGQFIKPHPQFCEMQLLNRKQAFSFFYSLLESGIPENVIKGKQYEHLLRNDYERV